MKDNVVGSVDWHWRCCKNCKHDNWHGVVNTGTKPCSLGIKMSSRDVKDDEDGDYICTKFEKRETKSGDSKNG